MGGGRTGVFPKEKTSVERNGKGGERSICGHKRLGAKVTQVGGQKGSQQKGEYGFCWKKGQKGLFNNPTVYYEYGSTFIPRCEPKMGRGGGPPNIQMSDAKRRSKVGGLDDKQEKGPFSVKKIGLVDKKSRRKRGIH